MKLLYMGTAAAEGIPALFCTCEQCAYARRVGGREIRGRAGAIIDRQLKIDFGPDSYRQMLDHGLDYTLLRSVLITHTHSDHLLASDISFRRPGFANLPENYPPLTMYGNSRLGEMLKPNLGGGWLEYRQMEVFKPVEIEGYTVTALEATHTVSNAPDAAFPVVFEDKTVKRAEDALFYLIEKDGKSILYAHDTDLFTPADMEFLKGKRLDLVSMDCTNASRNYDYIGHMGEQKIKTMRERLIKQGSADEKTVFVANHFSHNGMIPYEKMEKLLPGFIISYDGLEIEI